MKESKEKDRRKVVLIVAVIAAALVVLFVALNQKQESDPKVDPAPSAETSAPEKTSSRLPKTAYPTKGKYVEALLPRDEAEEAVTIGALSESAVGDIESKKYNSYSLEKDLQLAGPEQAQEVASRQEVTDALTVSSSPAPTATPDSAVQQAADAQKQTADNAAAEAQQAAEAAEAAAKAKAEAEAKAAADAAAKAQAEAAAKAEAEAAQAAAEAQQKAYAEAQAAAEAQQAAEAAEAAAKDQEVEAERQRICEASGGSYEHGACAYQQDDIEVISAESAAPADASAAAE